MKKREKEARKCISYARGESQGGETETERAKGRIGGSVVSGGRKDQISRTEERWGENLDRINVATMCLCGFFSQSNERTCASDKTKPNDPFNLTERENKNAN